MRHDEMIGKVQALAQLPDRGTAERATHAVLSTLSERLPSGLARHVAAQLPPGLAAAMRETADSSGTGSGAIGERFGLTVFAGRIADRAGTREDTALREAAAVLEVLDAALAPELTERMAGALPADIRELLPVGRTTENTAGPR
ncbi:DUF2267 domain-containing protein [Streptomyces pluripotens]|uniref:DUF2267 domain-containing protein n=1 Tax=Streptomyces pluripotens TaxID=1355015 RepID=A0A221P727_9ACTN|nr:MULTISPECIES: DUF2267 domain-containing protein [Streptomyces]ARP73676.1 hypothetical protein LK06_031085 [Streptomyces pluripotens]ASN27924.1 DUF2267 domain-containing protein [Streptomyces pluripotens]KIE24364.1 hypothetical protein LK08_25165 [Streptomyces sp. MUSC 125]MCH0559470.1 DUF2267 domain-containing protein [Streptomyces sp. MUM 16J]